MESIRDTAVAIVLINSIGSVRESEAAALLRGKELVRLYVCDVSYILIDSGVNWNKHNSGRVCGVTGTISGVCCVSDCGDSLVDICGDDTTHSSDVNQLICALALKVGDIGVVNEALAHTLLRGRERWVANWCLEISRGHASIAASTFLSCAGYVEASALCGINYKVLEDDGIPWLVASALRCALSIVANAIKRVLG